jgi:hypothetical protein
MKTKLLEDTAWRNRRRKSLLVPAAILMTSLLQTFAQTGEPASGTVVGWGGQVMPYVPPGVPFRAAAIAAGSSHSLALKSDGTVVAWGYNAHGESTVPDDLSGVIAIAAGGAHSLALKSDGTVVAWGHNEIGQSTVPDDLIGVAAIAAGSSHSLALKSDGTFVAWGWNWFGQNSVLRNLSGVIAIAAGERHNLAVVGDVAPPVEPLLLEIARAENDVVLKWPATAVGYVLESTPMLTPPAWGIVTGTPPLNGDQYEMTVPTEGSARLFRLRKP